MIYCVLVVKYCMISKSGDELLTFILSNIMWFTAVYYYYIVYTYMHISITRSYYYLIFHTNVT